jgi:hypothetical protein
MNALHVDVVDGITGAVVVPGAARSTDDLYYYTAEISRLAAAYSNTPSVSLATLAAAINTAGFTQTGHPLTGTTLGKTLEQVIAGDVAQNTSDDTSLLPRLVWQLGLLQKTPQDLSKSPTISKIKLDTLQAQLVASDFAFSIAYSGPPLTQPLPDLSQATSGIIGRFRPATTPGCDPLSPSGSVIRGISQFIRNYLGSFYNSELAALFLYAKLDYELAHGEAIESGVLVFLNRKPTSTDLGSGVGIVFTARVKMFLQLPQDLIDCGSLFGYTFPGYGGIEGVTLNWDNSGPGYGKGAWGSFICNTRRSCLTTGPMGTAAEKFTPKAAVATKGLKHTARFVVGVNAWPFASLGSSALGLADFGKWAHTTMDIGYYPVYPSGFTATYNGCVTQTESSEPGFSGVRCDNLSFTGTATSDCGFNLQLKIPPNPANPTDTCTYMASTITGTVSLSADGVACSAPVSGASATISLNKTGNGSIDLEPVTEIPICGPVTTGASVGLNVSTDGNLPPQATTDPWTPGDPTSTWTIQPAKSQIFTQTPDGAPVNISWQYP